MRSGFHAITSAALGLLICAVLAPNLSAQVIAERIGPGGGQGGNGGRSGGGSGGGIARFYAGERARNNALPSFALVKPVRSLGPLPDGFPVRPVFGTDEQGRQTVAIDIEPGTSLYATGEVAGPLLRNGRTVTLWNTDAYGYDEHTPSLYQSHPWVLAVRPDGSSFGVLADTTWRCVVDLSDGIRFAAEGPAYPVIVIDRDSPREVVMALSDLVGRITMPPKWAIGYHQCRYSYYPDTRVRDIASQFRDRNIPCDVIWLDIHYMNGYRVFEFDPSRFPDPRGLNDHLHARGFHTVWMIDPGIKAEPGYPVYDSGTAGDHWVKRADGSVYKGEVWPGWCVFPDFTQQSTRDWWAGLYKDFMAQGVDGVWNDMNEPAVFNVASKTMPEDNVHAGDPRTGPGPHARFHNVYGMLMVKATREGVMAANPDKRPFVLSRASYTGGHRYGAAWTGDNTASWHDLEQSIPMVLNLSLSGQVFCGPDIGGFIDDGTPEMFARWMGFGAMFPFARAHTAVQNRDKEPWMFGPEVEATCRQAIERRYQLLPYYYSLFHRASTTGEPIVAPVFFADPSDPALRSEDDAFLLGSDVLVVAQVTPNRDRVPAMPRGIWRPMLLSGPFNPDLPALYLRGGAIVPTGPIMQYADQKPLNPLTLLIALNEHGRAAGTLYEDAGDGWGYKKGQYLLTHYGARREGDIITVSIADQDGSMPRPDRTVRVRVLMDDGPDAVGTTTDGTTLRIDLSRIPRPE